jgi:hypothetical protein
MKKEEWISAWSEARCAIFATWMSVSIDLKLSAPNVQELVIYTREW